LGVGGSVRVDHNVGRRARGGYLERALLGLVRDMFTMSRYVRALRDLGIRDAKGIDVLAPRMEAFYSAASKLHRALTPYGGTAHDVLSRASAPSHDPDADEVTWVTIFDKLGLYNMDDPFISRIIDALFLHIWRHHEADMYITMLAAMRPGGRSARSPMNDDTSRGLPAAPSFSDWIASTTQPATIFPAGAEVAALRGVVVAIEKVPAPAILARRVAMCALLALNKHIRSRHYATTVNNSADDHSSDQQNQVDVGNGANGTGHGDSAGAELMETNRDKATDDTDNGGLAGSNKVQTDGDRAPDDTSNGGSAGADESQTVEDKAPDDPGSVGSAGTNGIETDGNKAPDDASIGGVACANVLETDDDKARKDGGNVGSAGTALVGAGGDMAPSYAGNGGSAGADMMETDGGEKRVVGDEFAAAARDAAGLFFAANGDGSSPHRPSSSPTREGTGSAPASAPIARPPRSETTAKETDMQMSFLTSHIKCNWWPSFKSENKVAAPAGTVANLDGDKTVQTLCSSCSFGVNLAELRCTIEATSFGRMPMFKMDEIDKDVEVLNLTNMSRRSLIGVFAVLVLMMRHEPTFTGILAEVVAGEIGGLMNTGIVPIVGGVVQVGRSSRQTGVNEATTNTGDHHPSQTDPQSGEAGSSAVPGSSLAAGSRSPSCPSHDPTATADGSPTLHPPTISAPSASTADSPASYPDLSLQPGGPAGSMGEGGRGRGGTARGGAARGGAARGGAARGAARGWAPRGRGGRGGAAVGRKGSEFFASSSPALDAAYIFEALPPSLARLARLGKRRAWKAQRAHMLAVAAAAKLAEKAKKAPASSTPAAFTDGAAAGLPAAPSTQAPGPAIDGASATPPASAASSGAPETPAFADSAMMARGGELDNMASG